LPERREARRQATNRRIRILGDVGSERTQRPLAIFRDGLHDDVARFGSQAFA
jgi:hypothetical protein